LKKKGGHKGGGGANDVRGGHTIEGKTAKRKWKRAESVSSFADAYRVKKDK